MKPIEIRDENAAREDGGCGCETACDIQKVEADAGEAVGPTFAPAVDIIDNGTETVLFADLPGVEENGIELTVEQNTLTIKAKPSGARFEGQKLLYSEYGVGDFQRAFALSEDVDRNAVSATIKDGVLRITLPKVAPVNKKIAVTSR